MVGPHFYFCLNNFHWNPFVHSLVFPSGLFLVASLGLLVCRQRSRQRGVRAPGRFVAKNVSQARAKAVLKDLAFQGVPAASAERGEGRGGGGELSRKGCPLSSNPLEVWGNGNGELTHQQKERERERKRERERPSFFQTKRNQPLGRGPVLVDPQPSFRRVLNSKMEVRNRQAWSWKIGSPHILMYCFLSKGQC